MLRHPVDVARAVLDQAGIGIAAVIEAGEGVEDGIGARLSDGIDGAITELSAARGRTINGAATHRQEPRSRAVPSATATRSGKVVQNCLDALRIDLEDSSEPIASAKRRRA